MSENKVEKKNSDAKIKANNKYTKAHYKQLALSVRPADKMMIDSYCKNNNVSKTQFIVNACKYCIDNDIKLFESVSNKDNKSETD